MDNRFCSPTDHDWDMADDDDVSEQQLEDFDYHAACGDGYDYYDGHYDWWDIVEEDECRR